MNNCPKKFKLRKRISSRGITLIEVLLYTALVTIFITLAMPLFIDINLWRARQSALSHTSNEYLFVHQYAKVLIENSRSVVSPVTNNFLDTLVVISQSGDEVTLGADLGGGVYVDVEGEEKIFLTSTSTHIDKILFGRTRVGTLEKIEFSLSLNGLNFGTTSVIISNE